MINDPIVIALLGGMGGIIIAIVGSWAKAQVERIGGDINRVEEKGERQVERDFDHGKDIAKLQTEVANLKELNAEERRKCADLAERIARIEAFQSWAEPLLERATAGLEKAIAFEAMFGEQLKTLFKGQAALIQRVERMLPQTTAH